MNKQLLFLAVICNLSIIAFGQIKEEGIPLLKNYTPKEYNASNQNWAVLQDARGVMYFGNNDGVLEYDGKSWRYIKIPNSSTVRSLAIDGNGFIYVGAQNEFGFLAPDALGQLQYNSLSNQLDSVDNQFLDVWKTYSVDDDVYFSAEAKLFKYSNQVLKKVWTLEKGSFFSFLVNDKLYLGNYLKGLMQLIDDSIKLVAGGEIFRGKNIFSMLPVNNDSIIIGTHKSGLYFYLPNESTSTGKIIRPLAIINDFLSVNQLYSGTCLSGNKYAFGFLKNGVSIIDINGKSITQINKQSGLLDETITSVYFDEIRNEQGPLWLSSIQGISKVELASPFRLWGEELGLKGFVYDIERFKGVLYVATSVGIFFLDNMVKGNPQFVIVENIDSQCWDLLNFDVPGNRSSGDNNEISNKLLVGCSYGVYEIENNKALLLKKSHYTYKLYASSKNPNKIFAGLGNGLIVFNYRDGEIGYEGKYDDISYDVRSIVEDGDGDLWLGTRHNGVIKINNASQLSPFVNTENGKNVYENVGEVYFNKSHGLPSLKDINIYNLNGSLLFATQKGFYKFEKESGRFVPDFTFGDQFADGSMGVFKFDQDGKGGFWINAFNEKKEWIEKIEITNASLPSNSPNKFIRTSSPFKRLPEMSVQVIFNEPNGTTWIGGSDGLYSFDNNYEKDYDQGFNALIRKVAIGDNDSAIFLGANYNISNQGEIHPYRISLSQPDVLIPELKYRDNNIKFNYAAPFFDDESALEYSYYLDGFDKQWSKWSKKTEKEYTNLPKGEYIFRVKAKNIYETVSSEASFKFIIYPPWYGALWAYTTYLLLAILVIVAIVRLNTKRLKREKNHLEGVIQKRTAEIRNQKDEIEEQRNKAIEQNEQIAKQNVELGEHRNHLEKLVGERTVELEKSKAKAEESNRLKTAFLNNMSHEIRTPMTAIIGFSSLMKYPDITNEERDEYLDHIFTRGESLLQLIDEIIYIAKIESKDVEVNKIQCYVNQTLFEIYSSFNKKISQKKDIKFELKFANKEQDIIIYTEISYFKHIINNLIDNAYKYTDKGKIELGYFVKNVEEVLMITFFVKDSGIGIPDKFQKIIFESFTKFNSDNTRLYGGVGIGLSVSRKLAEILGGDVWVESEPGIGSTFYFTLPVVL